MSNMKICVVLIVISSGCVCLSSVTVPSSRLEVVLGQSVVLQCDYDASDVEYISVTWYEVFRFEEDGHPDLNFTQHSPTNRIPIWRTDTSFHQNTTLNGYKCNFVYKGPLSETHAIRFTPSEFKPLLAYACEVKDAFRGSPIGIAGINVTLIVAPYPAIRQPSDHYVENQPASVHCDVPAVKPAADVTMWMELDEVRYDGDVTPVEHQNTTSSLSLTSTIPSVPWDAAGKVLLCHVEWRGKDYTADALFGQVKYAPKKNTDRKQRHPSINQSVLLNVSFWSFPTPSSVSWSAPNGPADSTWNSLGHNMYQSVLTVSLTLANNFGTYQYEITNEIGSLVGNIILETTKPDMPLNASITRQTAHSLLLLWAPGYNGGSPQTFTVSYKTQSQTSWQIHQESIPDPGAGSLASNMISELSPDVLYELQIVAVNVNGTSEPLLVAGRTRVLPTPPEDLQITQTENEAQISWTDTSKDYDSVVVRQCRVDTDVCINHTLTADHNGLVVTTEPGLTYTLTLLFYQHDQLVITSRQFTYAAPAEFNSAAIGGGIVGILVVIIVVIVVVLVLRRKQKHVEDKASIKHSDTNGIHGTDNPAVLYSDVDKKSNISERPTQDSIKADVPLYDEAPPVPTKSDDLQTDIQLHHVDGHVPHDSPNTVPSPVINHVNEITDTRKMIQGNPGTGQNANLDIVVPPSEESPYAEPVIKAPPSHKGPKEGIYVEVKGSTHRKRPRTLIGQQDRTVYDVVDFSNTNAGFVRQDDDDD